MLSPKLFQKVYFIVPSDPLILAVISVPWHEITRKYLALVHDQPYGLVSLPVS